MRAILAVTFLAILCAAAAGCPKPKPEQTYGDEAAKRRQFNELLNTGYNCLVFCEAIEKRKTELLKTSAPDTPEMRDLVDKQMKLYQQAEGNFREALRIDSSSLVAHQALCQILVYLGKYDEAIEHGLLVLQKAPARVMIYRVVAVAYERKGYNAQGAESLKNYEAAAQIILKYYPSDPDDIGRAEMVAYFGQLCYERLAAHAEGPEKIKQYDRIIDVLGGYLKEYPDNQFAAEMRMRLKAAEEDKAYLAPAAGP